VGFDKRQNDVDAASLEGVRLFEHLISFTDASSRSDKDFQPAALGSLHQFEKVFRAFAFYCHCQLSFLSKTSSVHPSRASEPSAKELHGED
jgi:hypothetical protein